MTDLNTTDSIASVASPEFDALAKFADGRKESHGPKGGMLARSVTRFVERARTLVDKLTYDANNGPGILLHPEVAEAMQRAKTGKGKDRAFHMDFTTQGAYGSLQQRIGDYFATSVANAAEHVGRGWNGIKQTIPGFSPLLNMATYGLTGSYIAAGFGLAGTATGLGLAALAGGAGLVHGSINPRTAAEKIQEFGWPVEVEHLPLGRFSGNKMDLDLPSESFMRAARGAIAEIAGDEAKTTRQMDLIDKAFSRSVRSNMSVNVASMGVMMNTFGVYSIVVDDPSNELGTRVVAREMWGELTILDQETFDRFSEKGMGTRSDMEQETVAPSL